jgi:hypothetical protein
LPCRETPTTTTAAATTTATTTASSSVWTMGEKGATCRGTCELLGKGCDASTMSQVAEGSDIVARFADAGYQCKSKSESASEFRRYAGTPFATGRAATEPGALADRNGQILDCYGLSSGAAGTCDDNSMDLHQPLCYCVTTTTTTCAGSPCYASCTFNEVRRRRRVADMCSCRRRNAGTDLNAGWSCVNDQVVGVATDDR